MKLWLGIFGASLILASSLTAGESPVSPATSGSQPVFVSGRKQLEALLQTPAKLDFEKRKQASIQEILDRLREQHHFSLRFDTPTLTSMLSVPVAAESVSESMPDASDSKVPSEPDSEAVVAQDDKATPAADKSLHPDPNVRPAPPDDKPSLPPTLSPAVPAQPLHVTLSELLATDVDLENLDLMHVSIATVLRHALEAAPTAAIEDLAGSPLLLSNAMLLDYLVEDDGLLITSRIKVLTCKETRVYSLTRLKDFNPDEITAVIRHSVRPWSWRAKISEYGVQLKVAPLHPKTLKAIFKAGADLAGDIASTKVAVNTTPSPDESDTSVAEDSEDETRQMEMLGRAMIDGLVTLAQATLSALEILHYADPPTGTIQTLGTKLVITQSQVAHREIAALLEELAAE
jgi:hypothetical protein